MTINITIRKLHLAIAVLAVALIAPATAFAGSLFDDVDDNRFYAGPIEWALSKGITTGSPAGSTTFKPDDPVTRGESVTFLQRYDDNIVQPGLDALETDIATNTTELAANTAGLATNTTDIAALDTAQPFAVSAFDNTLGGLFSTPTAVVTVTVTAPVAGHVTVNSTAVVGIDQDGEEVRCVIVESTDIPTPNITLNDESAQLFQVATPASRGTLSGTRTFAIAAGASVDYVLACQISNPAAPFALDARNLTAIFTPAP